MNVVNTPMHISGLKSLYCKFQYKVRSLEDFVA